MSLLSDRTPRALRTTLRAQPASLLPHAIVEHLRAATQIEPDALLGRSPRRTEAIDRATRAARAMCPHLFKD